MGKKKSDEPKIFSSENLPKEYLTAPITDEYQPALLEYYKRKLIRNDIGSIELSPSTEKFFRLYFYQGMTQPDRLLLHQQYLKAQSQMYTCVMLVVINTIGIYAVMNNIGKYAPFKLIRLMFAGTGGFLTFRGYKTYSTYKLESVTEPLYEKYAIR
ncbi:hypothetical protein SteCoe_9251 [Stentor coeruleus]|uniref:Uncharacterized protein n=1 Tax=Stentor coeruleus TaxID=5963 RepID=A0A1R2CIC9_9CILI|nr:hypothetical protein SteCoe_9251 [Stentor coeruleus]